MHVVAPRAIQYEQSGHLAGREIERFRVIGSTQQKVVVCLVDWSDYFTRVVILGADEALQLSLMKRNIDVKKN